MTKLKDLQKQVANNLNGKDVVQKLEAAITQLENNQTDIMDLQNAYQGIANQSTLPDDLEKYVDGATKTLKVHYFSAIKLMS